MNAAILFDVKANNETRENVLLVGKELYFYSMKVFYVHPAIDYVVLACCGSETMAQVNQYIDCWKSECSINKPVKAYPKSMDLQRILKELKRVGRQRPALYVFHDVRYPFVTGDMIYKVIEKAAIHGVALTAGLVKDDLMTYPAQEAFETENLRYMKYPAAFRAGHKIMDEIVEVSEVLDRCAECHPYLCELTNKNPWIDNWENVQMADYVIKFDRQCDKG